MAVVCRTNASHRGNTGVGYPPSPRWPATGPGGRRTRSRCGRRTSASGRSTRGASTWELVLDAAHGLLALGVDVGDRVSIHSEDRPEWVVLDLATVAVRGITVGLYPTNPAAEVEYLLSDSGAVVHLAEDQEQVDKVLAIDRGDAAGAAHDHLRRAARAAATYDDDRLMSWEDFLELGREHRAEHPGAVDERMAAAEPDDVMTLVYTSGTTGPPKGAMLTNANAAFCHRQDRQLRRAAARRQAARPRRPDRHLPAAVPRRRADLLDVDHGRRRRGAQLRRVDRDGHREPARGAADAVLRRAPDLGEAPRRRADQGPTTPPGSSSGSLRLRAAAWPADRRGQGRQRRQRTRSAAGCRYAIGVPARVPGAARSASGCAAAGTPAPGRRRSRPRCSSSSSASACPVFELYGMTENTAIATANFPGRMKLGTVGEPYPGIGLRLDPRDRTRSRPSTTASFAGYWGKPDKTAETFTDDGWLMTGDVGEWVDGTHVKHRRPHQAHHHHVGRQEHLAVGDREQPQDVAVRQGGDGHRRRPQVPHRADRHRARHGRRLGAAARTSRTRRTATCPRSRR